MTKLARANLKIKETTEKITELFQKVDNKINYSENDESEAPPAIDLYDLRKALEDIIYELEKR